MSVFKFFKEKTFFIPNNIYVGEEQNFKTERIYTFGLLKAIR